MPTVVAGLKKFSISTSAKNTLLQYSLSNLTIALEKGFELRFNIDDQVCRGCSNSSGICGSESESGNFRCLCSDKPHDRSCNDNKGESFTKSLLLLSFTIFLFRFGLDNCCATITFKISYIETCLHIDSKNVYFDQSIENCNRY